MQPTEPRGTDPRRPPSDARTGAMPPQSPEPEPERDAELDEDLKDTFPASDPVPPKHVD